MGRGSATSTLLALALAVCLTIPAAAGGTVTIGSNLGRTPDTSIESLVEPITVRQTYLTSTRNAWPASTDAHSLVNGTIVRWRISVGPSDTGPVALRVIHTVRAARPGQPGFYSGVGTSPAVTPPLGTVTPYNASIPIRRGDSIGLDCCSPGSGEFFVDGIGGASLDFWDSPSLADGDPGRTETGSDTLELAVNADIEPTATFPLDNIRPIDGGKVELTTQVTNTGSFAASDARDSSLLRASVAKKKKKKKKNRKRKLLKRNDHGVICACDLGRNFTLTLLPTKYAKRKLRAGKRPKVTIRAAFTPKFGSTFSQTAEVRLKP